MGKIRTTRRVTVVGERELRVGGETKAARARSNAAMRGVQVLYTAVAIVAVSSGPIGPPSSHRPSFAVPPSSSGPATPGTIANLCARSGGAVVRLGTFAAGGRCGAVLVEQHPGGLRNGFAGSGRRGLRPCAVNQEAASSAGAKVTKHKPEQLHLLDLDTLHDELEQLLDEQWLRASVESGMAPAPAGNTTLGKVKHVVGGFSVVVRLPEKGLAYRLQPMRSAKAGLTWVAFYMMLQEAAQDHEAGVAAAGADVLYRPDRSVVLGSSKYLNPKP